MARNASFAACLFVTALGINPGKNAFPKSSLPMAFFAKRDAVVLSPFACGEIAHGNSIMHCIAAHPSCPQVQRSDLRQWLQQMPLPASAARAVFVFTFFFFTFFSSFLFSRRK